MVELEELAELLRATSQGLRECLSERWVSHWKFSGMTVAAFLSIFVEQLRDQTGGKPHFRELATLIHAASGERISAKHLKVIASRRRPRTKRTPASPSSSR